MVKTTPFAVRDFKISNDTIFYLEYRDIHLANLQFNDFSKQSVEGYGLEFSCDEKDEFIIATNELVNDASAIRFYSKKHSKILYSYFHQTGKLIDFLKIPELNLFAISSTDKKITIINYENKTKFYKVLQINLDSLSRKMIFHLGMLYFCTDEGEIFQYNINDYSQKRILKTDSSITSFYIDNEEIIYATIDGEIGRKGILGNKKINLGQDFITTIISYSDKIICGSWKGIIYTINKSDFSVKSRRKYHKSAILKIVRVKSDTFYSSSIDKTIKEWKTN